MTDEIQSHPLMIYGSYGYTGKLILHLALKKNLPVIIAGRDEEKLLKQASALNLDHRVFSLDHAMDIANGLKGVHTLLNCAGPFSQTTSPLVKACVAMGINYLDITGEVDVLEDVLAMNHDATHAQVVLMPAVGFDVVPSDCLAALLAQKMPEAQKLTLGLYTNGSMSGGTTRTLIEGLGIGGRIRKNGKLHWVPAGWRSKKIAFGDHSDYCVTIPWGDVATAYHSTHIPNIEVYMAAPKWSIAALKSMRLLRPILGQAPVQSLLKALVGKKGGGPAPQERSHHFCQIWGCVEDPDGNKMTALLKTPDGYDVTAITAIAIAEKVLADAVTPGAHTPASALGGDFIRTFPEMELTMA